MGAVGGIASIAGLFMAPVTVVASLALAAAGAALSIAGGAKSAKNNITNMNQQKKLRQTIEKITSDFQNTVNPMIQLLSTIHSILQEIEQLEKKIFMKQDGVKKGRGLFDAFISELRAHIEKILAEIAKAIRVFSNFVKVVKAVYVSVQAIEALCDAANVARLSVQAMDAFYDTANVVRVATQTANAVRWSSQTVRNARVAAQAANAARSAAAVTGVFSAIGVVLDVASIASDSKELSEIKEAPNKVEAEDIKSETLKFIHQMTKTADQFQIILSTIEYARDILYEKKT